MPDCSFTAQPKATSGPQIEVGIVHRSNSQAGFQRGIGYGEADRGANPAVAFGSAVDKAPVNEAPVNAASSAIMGRFLALIACCGSEIGRFFGIRN